MLPYQGGVLTAFRNAGPNGYRVHWSPDGKNLGPLAYDGTSPVVQMTSYKGEVLTGFSNAGPSGRRIHSSIDGMHLGGTGSLPIFKSALDVEGVDYLLRDRTLYRFQGGEWELQPNVLDFVADQGVLTTQRTDGSSEVVHVHAPLPGSMVNSALSDSPTDSSSGRGRPVVGIVDSAADINSRYINERGESAAVTLLSSVGRVTAAGRFGTGTVLAIGGGTWVLTADHVIAGTPMSALRFVAVGVTRSAVRPCFRRRFGR